MQSFTAQPVYTEVNPGSPAMLECRVDNIGGECRWQKDGKVRKKLGVFIGFLICHPVGKFVRAAIDGTVRFGSIVRPLPPIQRGL